MSIGLGDLTTRAQDRIHAGDLAGAEELLGSALAKADPSPATATDELALAAALHAKVLLALGEAHGARGWASYAYAATTRLYGAHDPRTTDTATTLAAVLHRVGAHERAARLYHDVILELSAAEGPESARVLAAHADLATVEYARGDCATARTRLEDAWELHREVYGDGHPAGIRMLAKLGAMERDCGRLADSHAHLALAQELCRTHLPAEHPLIAQVAALARAAANPDHICAVEDSERIATDSCGPPPPRSPISPAGTGYARPFTPVPEHIPPVAPQPMTAPPAAPTPVAPPPVAPRPVTPTLGDGFASGSALDEEGYFGSEPPAGPRHAAADNPADRYAPETDLRSAYATEVYPPEDEDIPPRDWSPPAQRTAPEHPLWPDRGAADWPPDAGPSGWQDDEAWRSSAADEQAADTAWARRASATGEPTAAEGGGDEVWRRRADEDWDAADAWANRHAREDAWSGRRGGDERWAAPAEPPATEPAPADEGWERDAWGPDGGTATLPGGAEPEPQRPPPAYPRELEAGDEPDRRAARLPQRRPPDPLPVPYVEPRKRRVTPLVIAGLLVVILGAVAVIAGFALIDDPSSPVTQPTVPAATGPSATPPTTTPPTTAPPTARPGTPPGGVTLVDGTDQVTLRWTYPPGAAGPVVVSVGPTGQPPRPIEELPAGADNYVVYGLEAGADYCFVVGVVYPAGVVGRAAPVCTDRA